MKAIWGIILASVQKYQFLLQMDVGLQFSEGGEEMGRVATKIAPSYQPHEEKEIAADISAISKQFTDLGHFMPCLSSAEKAAGRMHITCQHSACHTKWRAEKLSHGGWELTAAEGTLHSQCISRG